MNGPVHREALRSQPLIDIPGWFFVASEIWNKRNLHVFFTWEQTSISTKQSTHYGGVWQDFYYEVKCSKFAYLSGPSGAGVFGE